MLALTIVFKNLEMDFATVMIVFDEVYLIVRKKNESRINHKT